MYLHRRLGCGEGPLGIVDGQKRVGQNQKPAHLVMLWPHHCRVERRATDGRDGDRSANHTYNYSYNFAHNADSRRYVAKHHHKNAKLRHNARNFASHYAIGRRDGVPGRLV